MKKKGLVLLSLYIDFIFVNTLAITISYLIATQIGYVSEDRTLYYGELLVSALVVAIFRKLFTSPGEFLTARWNAEVDAGRRLWPNLFLGTLLVLEGLKYIVRWMGFDVVMPVFGMIETSPLKIVVLIMIGTAYVIAGFLLLDLSPRSRLAALGTAVLSAASLAVSWPVLNDGIAQMHTARRAAQGVPIRDGKIEALQSLVPAGMIVAYVILLIVLFFTRERPAAS